MQTAHLIDYQIPKKKTSGEIRILSFNIHKGVGWHTFRKTLTKLSEQISFMRPDFILFQEICGSQLDFITKTLWPFRTYGKNAVYKKGHHGNAIFSKYPILAAKNTNISMGIYERRGLLHATVSLNNHPIHLLCVHLGLLQKDRNKQIKLIVDYIQQSIPETESLILGGDFNDWRNFGTEPIMHKLGLQEAFFHHHGGYARTFPAWAPILKLDRIYYRGFEPGQSLRLTQWKFLSDHLGLDVTLRHY